MRTLVVAALLAFSLGLVLSFASCDKAHVFQGNVVVKKF
jgi:hypothetical protein